MVYQTLCISCVDIVTWLVQQQSVQQYYNSTSWYTFYYYCYAIYYHSLLCLSKLCPSGTMPSGKHFAHEIQGFELSPGIKRCHIHTHALFVLKCLKSCWPYFFSLWSRLDNNYEYHTLLLILYYVLLLCLYDIRMIEWCDMVRREFVFCFLSTFFSCAPFSFWFCFIFHFDRACSSKRGCDMIRGTLLPSMVFQYEQIASHFWEENWGETGGKRPLLMLITVLIFKYQISGTPWYFSMNRLHPISGKKIGGKQQEEKGYY